MSAFGRRPGTAGRPAFGVAKPMQTGPGVPGGAQFPSIDTPSPADIPQMPSNLSPEEEAMERLNQRSTAEAMEPEKAQGFEASVHKIKEQVLPRLLVSLHTEQLQGYLVGLGEAQALAQLRVSLWLAV